MGEYPRLSSFDLDIEKFCGMIVKMTRNPEDEKMAPSDNIYRSDYDEVDGLVDITGYDHYEDDYADGWDDDDYDYDDAMDGDWDSGMASAGWGTDEDYGYYGEDY